jgi:hypothetical protein
MKVKILLDQHIIDHGVQPDLAEIVKSLGYEVVVAQRDPSRTVPANPVFNNGDCVIMYGSTAFLEQYQKNRDFHPGAYYSSTAFKCSNYMPHIELSLLANPDYLMLPYGDFKRRYQQFFDYFGTETLFVRPDSGGKVFAGQVIKRATIDFHLETLDKLTGASSSTMILISKAKNISREYRFFIVGGKIITGSMYMRRGKPYVSRELDADCIKVAGQIAAAPFQIDRAYCCDVGIVDGKPKVIELNSFSAAGLYASDVEKLFSAVAIESMLDYQEVMSD